MVVELTAELADEVVRKVAEAGGHCAGIECDVTDRARLTAALGEAIDQVGDVHCLVNVTGGNNIGAWNPILEYPDETYDAVMALNVDYVFTACRQVARHMVDQGIEGSIVNFRRRAEWQVRRSIHRTARQRPPSARSRVRWP